MSKRKLSREENREKRVRDILSVAEKAFVKKGFRGASMNGIAKDAKIGIGHLYHYFPSKEAVIMAIIRKDAEKNVLRLKELNDVSIADFSDVFAAQVGIAAAESMELFASALTFEIVAEALRNKKVAALVKDTDQTMRQHFAALLTNKLGIIDAEGPTDMIFTLMSGVSVRSARNPDLDVERHGEMVKWGVDRILSNATARSVPA